MFYELLHRFGEAEFTRRLGNVLYDEGLLGILLSTEEFAKVLPKVETYDYA